MANTWIVFRRAEVRLYELCRGASAALGQDSGNCSVGAHLRISVLDQKGR
jgi:hypothetical protein